MPTQLVANLDQKRTPVNQGWSIVTFKKPVQWTRGDEETWMFNPHRRYVLASSHLDKLSEYVDKVSELKGSRHHRPLDATSRLHDANILVDRYRDRGVGDLLFLTGPLSYIYELSGSSATIDMYTLVDRAAVLTNHPSLKYGPLVGPVHYDDLPQYTYHWFVEHATENDEEPDQLNVYDALYRQLGIDPALVPERFKRPSMRFVDDDYRDLDSVYMLIYQQARQDLRVTPYYVVAPLAASTLRSLPYATWLDIITKLSQARPVVVIGRVGDFGQVPMTDMTFGEFYQKVVKLTQTSQGRVINLMGPTPFKPIAALLSRAKVAVTLDSGFLYVSQACRVPAVSLWGTHDPVTRLGYDRIYMDLAIWAKAACPHSPCYAYAGFPRHRCPQGAAQTVCEVLAPLQLGDAVVEKVTAAENLGLT